MFRIDSEYEPIEKAATLGRRAVEQPVHGRHQPNHAQMIGKGRRGRHRLAVDAAFAREHRVVTRERFDAGAQSGKPQRPFYIGRDRPRSIPFGKRDVFQRRAPKAAPWRKE